MPSVWLPSIIRFASHCSRRGAKGHLQNILQVLEGVQPQRETSSGPIFHELAERFRKRGVVIILSDLFDQKESLFAGLKHFRHRRHDLIIWHVLDAAEIEFPFDEPTRFEGLEGMSTVETDPRGLRQAYQREFQNYLRSTESICHQSAMDYQRLEHGSATERGPLAIPGWSGTKNSLGEISWSEARVSRPLGMNANACLAFFHSGVLAISPRVDAPLGTGCSCADPHSFAQPPPLSRRRRGPRWNSCSPPFSSRRVACGSSSYSSCCSASPSCILLGTRLWPILRVPRNPSTSSDRSGIPTGFGPGWFDVDGLSSRGNHAL
jgi:hypothetical protein